MTTGDRGGGAGLGHLGQACVARQAHSRPAEALCRHHARGGRRPTHSPLTLPWTSTPTHRVTVWRTATTTAAPTRGHGEGRTLRMERTPKASWLGHSLSKLAAWYSTFHTGWGRRVLRGHGKVFGGVAGGPRRCLGVLRGAQAGVWGCCEGHREGWCWQRQVTESGARAAGPATCPIVAAIPVSLQCLRAHAIAPCCRTLPAALAGAYTPHSLYCWHCLRSGGGGVVKQAGWPGGTAGGGGQKCTVSAQLPSNACVAAPGDW